MPTATDDGQRTSLHQGGLLTGNRGGVLGLDRLLHHGVPVHYRKDERDRPGIIGIKDNIRTGPVQRMDSFSRVSRQDR
jgi:hypothetical protein